MNIDINYSKQDEININTGYYIIPSIPEDQAFNNYQIQLDDKIHQDRQNIDLYGEQNDRVQYVQKQFQYLQQNSIQNNLQLQEPLDQTYYNIQNHHAYQINVNPQIIDQQIGLINSYENQQNQPNQNNIFYQNLGNIIINVPENSVMNQQDNYSTPQQYFNYNIQITPIITPEYQNQTKTKKQRNQSKKNIQNSNEFQNDGGNIKKGKKQNKKSKEQILIENINYNNFAQEQANSGDDDQNIINNQDFQIENTPDKSLNQNIEMNDIQTAQQLQIQSLSEQYAKIQLESNLSKQESYHTIIGATSGTIIPDLQQNKNCSSNDQIDIKQNTESLNEEQVYKIQNSEDVSQENNVQLQYDLNENDDQCPEKVGTKKRQQKKTKKNNQNSDEPPKKQRQKKQKEPKKSIQTTSTSTTISILPLTNLDYSPNQQDQNEENKINQTNQILNLQTSQSDLIQDNIENTSLIDKQLFQLNYNENVPTQYQNNGSLQQIENEDLKIPVQPLKKRQSSKRQSKKSIKAEQNLIQIEKQNDESIKQDQKQNDLYCNTNYVKNPIDNFQFQNIQSEQILNNPQFNDQQVRVMDKQNIEQSQDNNCQQQLVDNNCLKNITFSNQNEKQFFNENIENLNYQQVNYSQINQNISNVLEHNQQQKQLLIKIKQDQTDPIIYNDTFPSEDQQTKSIKIQPDAIILKKKRSSKKRKDVNLEVEDNINFGNKIDEGFNEQQINDQDQINIEQNGIQENNQELQIQCQTEEQIQSLPEETPNLQISKKRSSISSGCKTNRRKRKIDCMLSEIENINKSSYSDQDDKILNNQLTISKEKSIHEKKRGLRDLTVDEKWDVYEQGVGRVFNMDHSTVKLLIQRINNERPGEVITKEIFFQSSIVQQCLEPGVSKKLKKDQTQNQNKNNQKCEKQTESDPNSIVKNSFEQQEYKIDEQIDLYNEENNNSQQRVVEQFEINETQNRTVIESQQQINENTQITNFETQELQLPVITKNKSKKEKKNQSTQKIPKSRGTKKNQFQVEMSQQDQLQQQDQVNGINENEIEYQYDQQQNYEKPEQQNETNQNEQNMVNVENVQHQQNQSEEAINDNQNGYQLQNYDYNYYQQQENEQQMYSQNQNNEQINVPQTHQLPNQELQQQNQNNIFCDINLEDKIEDEINSQQQEIEQEKNYIASQQSLQTLLRRKSSQKMTLEEKQARKEIRRQFKEQQKASIIKEEKPKKKGKNKGQMAENEYQNEQENALNQKQHYNNYVNQGDIKENEQFNESYEVNIQYIPQGEYQNNYNFVNNNNYEDKYDDDYDINIDGDINDNYGYQQQQQNQQYFENDEIKLELM